MTAVLSRLSLALVHHPVIDKHGDEVTTSIFGLDIHDICRSARTFGVEPVYITHPVDAQRRFAERIVGHWQEAWGSSYNPKRRQALEIARIVPSVDDALADLGDGGTRRVFTATTHASTEQVPLTLPEFAHEIAQRDRGLLIFGTGWGMSQGFLRRFDGIVEPIAGVGTYNHLSVRSAVAIYLDRLSQTRIP